MLIRNLLLAQHDGNAAHRARRPGDRAGAAARPVSVAARRSTPKCKQLVVAAGVVSGRAAGRDDQERCGRGEEAVRRVADADRRGRLGSRRRAAVSWREHREGFRVGARASGRRRLPRVQADALRRAGVGAGGRALRGASRTTATSSCPSRARSRVLDDGRTQFTPAADGKHRYLIVDPAQKERVIELYTAMVSAQPAPRPGRGRAWQR